MYDDDPGSSLGKMQAAPAAGETATPANGLLKLTPNPARESFRIAGIAPGAVASKVQITNLKGQILKQWKQVTSANELQVSGMAAGTYQVLVFAGGKQYALTLVLNH